MDGVNLHFYSERGIVNSIIFWISKQNNKEKICELLKTIMDKENKQIFNEDDFDSLDIYDEFSFGDFGSPDLILKIITKEKAYLLFIEAKVGTYMNSAAENVAINDIVYEANASKINVQLSLRKRFMELPYNIKEYVQEKSNETDYDRKLKKESLIKWVNNHLKDREYERYYISLTNDEDNPYSCDSYYPLDYENSRYGYWLYTRIKHVLKDFKEYDMAWEYTIGEELIQINRKEWNDIKADEIIIKQFSNYKVVNNKTARTIKYQNGNSIFRLWKTDKNDKYLLEIIDELAFSNRFDVDYDKVINEYLLIDDLSKICERT